MLEERADLLKAIAHPSRLSILESLRGGEKCVCKIIEEVGLEQSNTSQHLNILKKSGVLGSRKEGPRVIYWVNYPEIFELIKITDTILMNRAEKLSKIVTARG
ncbi:MAG TPA: metalloregulator ArsR/SmtB family transcription factor [Bacillota bacterium]|nr:metalloregulator ArsR/SmtB family transcription factor [Bacillota bacterium]